MEKNYSFTQKKISLYNKLSYFLALFFATILLNTNVYAQNCTTNAGLSRTICENTPFTLNGVVGGNIVSSKWTQVSGPSVVIENPNILNTNVLGAVGGNVYTFRLSSVCTAGVSFQDVVITVNKITTARTGANIMGCPGTYNLSGNAPLNSGETGLWTIVGSNASGVVISTPSSPTSAITFPTGSIGTSTLRWTITGPGPASTRCSSQADMTVTNYGGVVIANAGPDQNLSACYDAKQGANLNASVAGNGTGTQIGTWGFVSGPSVPVISSVNNPTTGISNLVEGSYVFRWTVMGPCAQGSDTVTINVPAATQGITNAVATNPNQNFCSGVTQTLLQGNVPLRAGETVEWTQIAGPTVTIVNPNSPTTQVTGLDGTSNYTFRYTIKGGAANPSCSSVADVNIRYYLGSATISLNGGVNVLSLAENITSGTVSIATSGGNANAPQLISSPAGTSPVFSISGNNLNFSNLLKAGTYTFRVRHYTNGEIKTSCSEAFDDVNIIVSLSPPGANAGTSLALACGVTSGTLSGNVPDATKGHIGRWSQLSGPTTTTFSNVFSTNPVISNLMPGIYTYRWTITGGLSGIDKFSDVNITVSAPPTSTITPNLVTSCAGNSLLLTGNELVGGTTGLWQYVSGPGTPTFSDPTKTTTNVMGLLPSSTYVFSWTVTSPNPTNILICGPSTATVTITTLSDEAPSIANAGPDACFPPATNSATLGAAAPTVGTGAWSFVSGPNTPVITNPALPNTTVTGLVNGIYEFEWTTSNLPCGNPSKDRVKITIAAEPTSAAGPDQNFICGSTIAMAANAPTAGLLGTWIQISGSGGWSVDNINSPTAVFSNLAEGNYEFQWKVAKGSCTTATDNLTFRIQLPPTTANAGGDQTICGGTTATLAALPVTQGVGTWSVISGPNNPTITTANGNASTVTGLVTGTYTLRWTTSSGGICAESRDDMVLNVSAPVSVITPQNLCAATSVLLQANTGSSGVWTLSSSTGGPVPIISAIGPNSASATITPGFNYVFTYTTNSFAGCPAGSADIAVFNSAVPATPYAGPDQSICTSGGTSVTMAATGTPGTWVRVSGPNTPAISSATNPNAVLSGLVEGLYVYQWTTSNGFCATLNDVVRIYVYDPPTAANAGPDQTSCQLATKLDATVPLRGIGKWTLTTDPSNGGIIIDSPNDPKSKLTIANPYLLPIGTYTFTWTVTNGPLPYVCVSSTDTVNINFSAVPPTPANAGPDQTLCGATSVTMNANNINPGIGTWTQVSGPSTGVFSDKFSPQATVTGLVSGVYEFKWTSSNTGGGCQLEDNVKVTISPAVANVNAGPDQFLGEYNTVTMAALNPSPNVGVWSIVSGPNTPLILNVNSPTTQIAGTIPGTYVLRYTVANGICAEKSDDVVIVLTGQTDLSLLKSANTTTPAVGSTVTFTVAVKNNGARNATGVAVNDILPSGFTLVPGSVSNAGIVNTGNNSIIWSGLSIANGATLNLTYQVKVNATTAAANEYRNTAQITASDQIDPNSTPNNNVSTEDDQSTVTLIPSPRIDLAITKQINNTIPNVGSTVQFTIEVVNNGPSTATGVVATDQLPTGYTFSSATPSIGTYNATSGAWTIGNLANGAKATLTISATVNATGNYVNTATVKSTEIDVNPANDNSVVSSIPRAIADLSLTKTVTGTPNVGSNVTFTITITNAGPSVATGVNVVDYLPSGYTYLTHTSTGTTYSNVTGSWNIGTLNSSASRVLIVIARINPTGDYRNTAQVVSSNEFDPDSTPGNNNAAEDDQAQVVITPIQRADLSVVKTVDLATPRVGDNVKFRIALNNAGPSDATGVVVNDLLPSGYTFVSYTSTSGLYNSTSGNWTLSGSVINGKTEYLDIVAKVNPITGTANEYRNNAQVIASGQTDPDSIPNDGLGDDFSTVTTVPTALIDLSLTKSVDNISPSAGSNVVFTVRVSNAGPSTATGVQVRDVLPSGYTIVGATPSSGTYTNATGLWTIATIANGASAVLTVTATVNATGNYTNVAEIVAADQTDVNSTPGNNILTEDDQDQVTISRGPLVDLSLTKSVNNNTPIVGENVTFRITISNAGPSEANGVVVTDKLPSGYSFVSSAPSVGTYNNISGSWTVGNLANAGTATLDITAKVLPTGNYNNIAEVTGVNEVDSNSTPGNNDATENDQSEVVITPVQSADLSVVKTVNITTPKVGDTVTFTIAVKNDGPSNATGVVIKDMLPSGYEFVSASPTAGMYNTTTGLWTVSRPITANTTETILITAKVLKNGSYVNTAEVIASDQPDPDSTPNNTIGSEDDQSTVTTTPSALVNLAVVKRINNVTPDVGSTVVFTLEVINNGPSDATNVVVTDNLPSGYTFSTATASIGTYSAGTGQWTIGSLANGAKATIDISATVNPTGIYLNTATATSTETDGNPDDNTSSVSSTPRAITDLSLTKTVSAAPHNVGSDVTFTVTVTNAGPSAATGVNVVDYLPSGYTYVSHTSVGVYFKDNGSWNIGTINNGASAVLTVVARVNATGDYRNTAQVVSSNEFDPNSTPGNNSPTENDQAQVVITPVQLADLSVVKTVDLATPRVGDNVKFRIALNNVGPSDATGVVVNDLLPSGYAFVSYTSTSGLYDATNGNWTLSGSVINGKTEYLDIVAKVNPITGTANEYRNNAQVIASGQTDPDSIPNDGLGDDFSTVTTVPTALIDLSLTKSVDNISPSAGSNVVFTVRVSNAGPSTATGVQVRDVLPSGYTIVGATPSSGTYTNATGLWTIATIANGASAVLTVTATVNATGNYTNVAEIVAADQTDVNSTPGNNILTEDDQDQVTISRGPLVDLSLTKSVNNNTPIVGENVTFRITISNAGPSEANGVVVTDKLPSGYSFVSSAPSVGTYNNISGSWTVGNLANAGTATLDITAKVLPTGNYNNIAEVTGVNEVDSNSTPGNNDATENDQSEVVITPVQSADLSVVKTVNITTPKVGDTVTFTIAVKNDGPSNATGVVIKDMLPSGYEFVSASPTAGMYNTTTGLWTVSRPITANTTETILITAKVLKNGSYVNTAEVIASDQPDPDSTPNNTIGSEDDQSTVTTTPSALVNLAVVKRINNVTPDVGSTVVFTLEVVNNGPSDATNVVVTDKLPTGYTFVSDDAAGAYNVTSGAWTIGDLANRAKATVNISATVNATGNYTNTATVTSTETDGNPDDNTSSVSSTPRAITDLSLTKTVSAAPHNVGSDVTFTVTVTNAGPSAATGVNVVDYLPSGYTYVSHTSVGVYFKDNGSWNIGTINNGASAVLTVVARVNATGDYRNTAQVVSSNEFDPNSTPGNNSPTENDQAQVVITPVQLADLSVVKTVDLATPRVGDNVKFRIALSNAGPSDATGVVVNDLLSSGYAFVSYTSTSGLYNSTSGDWTLSGSVFNGKTEYLDIIAKVNPITGTANEYRNTAQVIASGQTDPDSIPNDGIGDDFSTISTVPTALIDLSLTKGVDKVEAQVGSNVVFTVTVKNAGPSTATGVQVIDKLPSGYTFISATSSIGTYINGTGLWTIPTIANGASAVLTVTATVNATGNYTNVAEIVAADQTDVNSTPGNNVLTEDDQDQVTISRDPLVDLSLTKSINNNTPIVGENVTFRITVSNAGPSEANGVVVTDKLPSGYSFVSAAPSVGTYNNISGSWTIGNLANAGTATLDITAKVLPTGNYNNIAEVTGTNEVDANSTPGNNDATENDQSEVIVTPIQSADLSVVKTVDLVGTPKVGDTVTFTIAVKNDGPSDATGVVIKDLLPSGYEFVSASPTAGMYNRTTGLWTVSRPIKANTTENIPITAKVLKNGNYTNTAEVTASDQPDPDSTPNDGTGDDFSTVTTTPSALVNLAVVKRINNATPDVGSTVVFTLEVINNGPSDATNVVVTDDLPSGYTFSTATASIGTYSAGTGQWTIGSLANGAKVTIDISATVNPTGIYLNTATAISTETDGNPTDNTSSVSSTPRAIADLSLVKTVVNASPNIGENAIFNIVVTNNGPSDATNIVVTDRLPSGYSFVSAVPSVGTFNSNSGGWSVGNLSSGNSATLTITAKVLATGNYNNVAEVTGSDQFDPNSTPGNNNPQENDQSVVVVTPVNVADLVTTKTVDKSNPNQGDIVQYTITVVNNGPSIATGVNLMDNLPVGTTYVSHIATGGTVNTFSGGQWAIGNINIGSSATLVIRARVTAPGTSSQTPIINVTTAAVGNESDPTTVGDDLTEPIIVTSSDLVTEKTVSKSNPSEGETITYSIKVTNNGPSDATKVYLTDILPIGVTYVSNNHGTDYNYGSGIWTIGDLANGATKVLNIDVIINSGSAGKTIINRTTAAKGDQSDPTTVGDDLEEIIIVQNGADVVLTKVVNNRTPNIGETVTYTVTVTNKGTTLVTNLVVKDDLPAGLTFVSATPGKGVWTTPNWTVGTLQPGEEGSIEIKAIVDLNQGGSVLTNTVSNTQDQFDTNITLDDPTETITVTSLDLAVVKKVNNARPNEGETIRYTITVTNNGASNATNVSLVDKLPVGVTYVSDIVSAGNYNNGSGLWTIGNLINGAVATLTIDAKVNTGTYDTTITNTTTAVKADQADSNAANNIGSVAITPTAFIDLSLTKEVVGNVTNPAVGDIITFEVRVMNDGPTKATGVEVVDLIPSGYKFINYSSTIGTYSPSTGLWKVGFVEAGNTAVLLVDVKVLDNGNYMNCAEITKANEPDIDSTPGNGNVTEDDYACASAPPNQSVDLAVVKTILKNNTNPKVNSQISFEILLTNNGNIDATNVVVSDLLPSGYTFVNYSSTKGIYDYVTGDWKVSKILNGETEILIVDVIVNESGDYLNCASIKALHQVDTDPANNVSCIAATPIAVIDLELTKVVDELKPIAETNVEFTITLSNKGPSIGTGVEVKDLLPTGFNFVSATTTTGVYDATTGIWKVGSIDINAIQTLKVIAYVLPVGEFTNVAEVIAANELDVDSTPGNNKLQEDDQDAITIEPEVSLVMPEGFTPNGDGINDVFEVEHLQVLYPNFSMEIVNRYGNIVYNYKHNGDKFKTPLWWDGHSTGRWNFSKEMLPTGTYFYTIYFNNDERKPQTGWIYLKK